MPTADTTRSGQPTTTAVADATQLFPSFDSFTIEPASAQAMRRYVPGTVVVGTVTVAPPIETAPPVRIGTLR